MRFIHSEKAGINIAIIQKRKGHSLTKQGVRRRKGREKYEKERYDKCEKREEK